MKKLYILLFVLVSTCLLTRAQVKFCLPVEDLTLVTLHDPGISNVEIGSGSVSDTLEFNTDMIIEETSDGEDASLNLDEKTIQVWAKGQILFVSDSASSEVESLAGYPNTRIDITAIKGGFRFNDRTWYPKGSEKAFIICTKDKVIGYNVDIE